MLDEKIVEGKYHVVKSMFFSLLITLLISTLCLNLASFTDSICISRYLGDVAVAANSLVKPLFKFLGIFAGIVSAGLQIVLGNELGKGNIKAANRLFTFFFVLCVVFGLILLVLGLTIPQYLAVLFGASDLSSELNQCAADFIKGILIGGPFYLIYTSLLSLYSFDGGKKLIKACSVICVVFDIIFDILNGQVFKLGMFGMGLATSVSYALATIPMLVYLFLKKSKLRLDFTGFSFKGKGKVFLYGLPKAVSRLCTSLEGVIVNFMMLTVGGSLALTAIGIQGSVYSIVSVISSCIPPVFISLLGIYSLDHDDKSVLHVLKIITLFNLSVITPIVALAIGFAPLYIGIFGLETAESVSASVLCIQICFISIPLSLFNMVFLAYLQALKKIKLSSIYTVIFYFVSPIMFTALFGFTLGTVGLWIAFPVTEAFNFLFSFVVGCIKKKKVENPIKAVFNVPEIIGKKDLVTYHFNMETLEANKKKKEEVKSFLEENNISEKRISNVLSIIDYVASMEKLPEKDRNRRTNIDLAITIDGEKILVRVRDDNDNITSTQRAALLEKQNDGSNDSELTLRLDNVCEEIKTVDFLNIHNTLFDNC